MIQYGLDQVVQRVEEIYDSEPRGIVAMKSQAPEADILISKVVPSFGATCVIELTTTPVMVELEVSISPVANVETSIGSLKVAIKSTVVLFVISA